MCCLARSRPAHSQCALRSTHILLMETSCGQDPNKHTVVPIITFPRAPSQGRPWTCIITRAQTAANNIWCTETGTTRFSPASQTAAAVSSVLLFVEIALHHLPVCKCSFLSAQTSIVIQYATRGTSTQLISVRRRIDEGFPRPSPQDYAYTLRRSSDI